jgi:hypothetical protein
VKDEDAYEAPRVRDLEELGLRGQFPLGDDNCTSGLDSGCTPSGTDDDGCAAGIGDNTVCVSGN